MITTNLSIGMMMEIKKMSFITFLVLLVAFPLVGMAEEDFKIDPATSKAIPTFSGKALIVKGEVSKIDKAGVEQQLGKNSKIYRHDTIVVGAKSFLKLLMIDDTIISLGPKSKLEISEFKFKTKTRRTSVYNFIEGQMRTHVVNKVKKGKILIKTKSAALGVRGTVFLGSVRRNKDNKHVTQFAVLKGKVEVENNSTKKNYLMKAGDHFVSIEESDSNYDEDVVQLNQENYQMLLALGQDEQKKFNPFLDFWEKTRVRGRGPDSIGPIETIDENNRRDGYKGDPKYLKTGKRPGWKNKMDTLNQRLDEYNAD